MKTTTIELMEQDAAIILRSDGTYETSLPQVEDELVPENIMLGAALALALQDADLCDAIRANFYKVCGSQDP